MSHPSLLEARQKMNDTIEHLKQELGSIRTGIAHPSLVENISVESYGTSQPLKTLSSVSTLDKTTIVIQPWDKSIVSSIEKSLQNADIGAQPVSDGHSIRISMPAPTEDQRVGLCKLSQEYGEQGRISIRTIRSDAHSQIKKLKESSDITEDDFYSLDKELQGIVDTMNSEIEKYVEQKEKDIMTI